MSAAQESANLSIECDAQGVLHLVGDIDMAGGPLLDAAISERRARGGGLVIDLDQVPGLEKG